MDLKLTGKVALITGSSRGRGQWLQRRTVCCYSFAISEANRSFPAIA